MVRRGLLVRASLIGAIALGVLLGIATVALADPTEPVMHFADLRAALAASPNHHLNGYMKTVVEGAEITTIPVTVLAVPQNGTADDDLIMFEATGPLIQKYGGIVEGMSGSPIFVDDGTGTDKLIGAVSYGDQFTLGGTGLATPIDAMSEIENTYSSAIPLSQPIITSNGVVNQVIVAPDPQKYAGAAATGAFVAKPLAEMYIGGLPTTSRAYKALASDLASKGVTVVPLAQPLAGDGGPGDGGFTTTLTAGASIGAMVARGDLWEGAIGTVTYADGDNVLAFGHPASWTGPTSLYMTNAWIEGVWPNSFSPYKVADPGAIRGTITQDRLNGIMGKSDLRVTETTITSTAHDTDTGADASSTVYVPRALIANGFASGDLVGAAVYEAGSKLFDMRLEPGSAYTTTTVTLLDHGTTETITMANYSSESDDVVHAASRAAATAITTLQSVLPYGIEEPQVVSVDLQGSYSAQRTDAEIVDIDAPNGLHIGTNTVRVSVLEYGVEPTQTVDTTLTIPAGTPLGGTIEADAASYSSPNSMTSGGYDSQFTRKTIKGLVDDLNKSQPDPTIILTYRPPGPTDPYGDPVDTPSTDMSTITKQFLAPWPVSGGIESPVTTFDAHILPNPISYGGFAFAISGTLDGPSEATTIAVYEQNAGSPTESFLGTVTATPDEGVLTFEFPIMKSFTSNATFRLHTDETDSSTSADQYLTLNVQGIVALKASSTKFTHGKTISLGASVFPASAAGGQVVFERQNGRKWIAIATKTLASAGSRAVASTTWKPSKGSYRVRVRYTGGTYNSSTSSALVNISVK